MPDSSPTDIFPSVHNGSPTGAVARRWAPPVGQPADPLEPEPSSIRVLVADDDPLTRRVIRDHLDVAGVTVVAEARNGREAVRLALELRPDLVLMDIVMPVCDGITATRQLAEQAPNVQVVILSVIDDEELGLLALRCGAAGFLNKNIDLQALPRVVRGVGRGEAAIKRTLTRRLLEEIRRTPPSTDPDQAAESSLTLREQEVLGLLVDGGTTASISVEMGLALETVRGYVKNVLRKLGVHSRREAVESARRSRREPPRIPADIAAALSHYRP